MYLPPGCRMKRHPLATIHGLRVGEATPARATIPGAGSASREASSASLQSRLMPAASSAARLSLPCVQTHGTERRSRKSAVALVSIDFCLIYFHVPHFDFGQVVHAKAERRRVFHVPGLANDDVDVGIRIPRPSVVEPQRIRRAVPDRDRTVRTAFLLDDVEQQTIDGDGVGPKKNLPS